MRSGIGLGTIRKSGKSFSAAILPSLITQPEAWQPLARAARAGDITLLFSARDTACNNALALRAYLTKKAPARARGRQGKRAAA